MLNDIANISNEIDYKNKNKIEIKIISLVFYLLLWMIISNYFNFF